MRVMRGTLGVALAAGLSLACLLFVGVKPAAAVSASVVGVPSASVAASEASASGIRVEEAQPVSNCACDEIGEVVRWIVKRFGVPLPTLPPPPGIWWV